MKYKIVLALLALGQLSVAQDLGRKIDYTTVAVPLSRALDDISKQAGVQLLVQDDLANEIIVLRLKGVTTDEAMKRIASTVGGEWVKREQGFDLERDDELASRLKQAGLEARAEAVKALIAKKLKESGAGKPLDEGEAAKIAAQVRQADAEQMLHPEDFEAARAAHLQLPDQRATWKLLARIDPSSIAAVESGDRVVFSNRPTAMQTAISADLSDIGLAWMAEHNMVAADLRKLNSEPSSKPAPIDAQTDAKDMKAEPVRFVISVKKQFFSQSYQIRVMGFDATNKPVVISDSNADLMEDFRNIMSERARLARSNPNEPVIHVTPVTQAMLDFMRNSTSGSRDAPAAPEVKQALLKPDTTDPLAYVYSEAFLGVAEARNENLVAYPDDSGFLISMIAGMEGELKPSLVMQAVTSLGPMVPTETEEKDGWLTIAPMDRIETLRSRADRRALGQLLRDFDRDGYLTLAGVGKVAQTVKTTEYPVLDQFLPMMLQEQSSLDSVGDLQMLKLYGSLDDGQLTRLKSKLSIRIAELRPEQAACVTQFVFSGQNKGQRIYSQGGERLDLEVNAEPTEAMPDGLPNDATVTMDFKETPIYFMKIDAGQGTDNEAGDMMNVAQMLYLDQHPERSPNYHPKILSISPGTSRHIDVYVNVNSNNQFQSQIREQQPTPGGPWTLATLPDDIKKELDAELARFSRLMEPQNGGDSGAPAPQNPPTPPPSAW